MYISNIQIFTIFRFFYFYTSENRFLPNTACIEFYSSDIKNLNSSFYDFNIFVFNIEFCVKKCIYEGDTIRVISLLIQMFNVQCSYIVYQDSYHCKIFSFLYIWKSIFLRFFQTRPVLSSIFLILKI